MRGPLHRRGGRSRPASAATPRRYRRARHRHHEACARRRDELPVREIRDPVACCQEFKRTPRAAAATPSQSQDPVRTLPGPSRTKRHPRQTLLLPSTRMPRAITRCRVSPPQAGHMCDGATSCSCRPGDCIAPRQSARIRYKCPDHPSSQIRQTRVRPGGRLGTCSLGPRARGQRSCRKKHRASRAPHQPQEKGTPEKYRGPSDSPQTSQVCAPTPLATLPPAGQPPSRSSACSRQPPSRVPSWDDDLRRTPLTPSTARCTVPRLSRRRSSAPRI